MTQSVVGVVTGAIVTTSMCLGQVVQLMPGVNMEHTVYIEKVIRPEREEAYRKAIKALAGYKFYMFGYWAAHWVKMNHLDPRPQPNPFKAFVLQARNL